MASQIISVSFKISSVKVSQGLVREFVLYFSTMDNQIQAKMDPDEEIEGFRVVVQSLGIIFDDWKLLLWYCVSVI